MNRQYRATLGLFLALLPHFVFGGPVFAPGTRLFVVRTEHFDIIFSEKSRPSATRLSSIAESVYAEVSGKLQAELPKRVPVVITPDIGSLNGYASPFPYMHIVLYDSSIDLGWTSFKDNFRYLFLHELTHAVSLQVRAPWASFLSGIFGSWIMPSFINAPEFMVEGVTVSYESADGLGGRANDPLVKERVRQDIWENRFKSPMEASGIYEDYPYGSIHYEYGGLFSDYLQKTYGMAKYAELWRNMGTLALPTSLDPYELFFYKAFEKTYRMPFLKVWAAFRNSLTLVGLSEPAEVLRSEKLAWLYHGMAAGSDALYWVDARSSRAMKMELGSMKSSVLFDANERDSISDVSADGSTLLVCRTLDLPDTRDRIETVAYDLAKKRFDLEGAIEGMRDARFFRDGVVGIASRLHYTDLVFAPIGAPRDAESGGRRTLLAGSERVAFASPVVIDGGRIALIVAVDGARHLGILDPDSGVLGLVKPEGSDSRLFDYVRQLSWKGGKIYFNYDSDDRMYKLGLLDVDRGEIRVETIDYSGGIHWPQEVGGRIYYVSRLSEGDAICAYPAGPESIGQRSIAYGLEPFDARAIHAESEASIEEAASVAKIGPYRSLAYANPFNQWYLYPDLANISRSFRLFGEFYFEDPIDTNSAAIRLGYDATYPFAEANVSWTSLALPVSLSASLADSLVYGASGPPIRQTSASIGATLNLPLYPSSKAFAVGLSSDGIARWKGESGSPYGWSHSGSSLVASGQLGFGGKMHVRLPNEWRGFDLVSYHDIELPTGTYKTELHFSAALDRIPLWLDAWGAWASSSVLRLDSSSDLFLGDRRPAYAEYATLRNSSSTFVAEGGIQCRLMNEPIHANLFGLYFNRGLVDLGLRGAFFDEEPLYSAYARLSLDIGQATGMVTTGLRCFFEEYACLSETDPTKLFGWRLGIKTSTDAMGGAKDRGVFE